MAKISKHPQFYSQKWPTKTATKSWRLLLYFWSLLSQFICLFLLVSLISCCFMTSWNPKTAHQMRLQAYIYIYLSLSIYGCGAICRRKCCHFCFLPQFYSKNGKKEMLHICPISVRSRSIEMTKSFFQRKWLGLQTQPFFLVHLGLTVKCVGLLAPKTL